MNFSVKFHAVVYKKKMAIQIFFLQNLTCDLIKFPTRIFPWKSRVACLKTLHYYNIYKVITD